MRVDSRYLGARRRARCHERDTRREISCQMAHSSVPLARPSLISCSSWAMSARAPSRSRSGICGRADLNAAMAWSLASRH